MKTKMIYVFTLAAAGSIYATTAFAQKLPNIQPSGMRAPNVVKIDGNTTEWTNGFQAYNKATGIFYTVANDSEFIYLVVQSSDPQVVEKIMAGGITLQLKSGDKENRNKPTTFTYPILPKSFSSAINNKWNSQFGTARGDKPEIDTANVPKLNAQLANNAKEIAVTGISAITDTLISVYNEQDIKAAIKFDNNSAFTYELAVPLKYLQPFLDNGAVLKYNIKLNGLITKSEHIHSTAAATAFQDLTSPTDFSGDYKIVGK